MKRYKEELDKSLFIELSKIYPEELLSFHDQKVEIFFEEETNSFHLGTTSQNVTLSFKKNYLILNHTNDDMWAFIQHKEIKHIKTDKDDFTLILSNNRKLIIIP